MLVSAKASLSAPQAADSIPLPADFSGEQDVLVLAGTGAAAWLPDL
jgi:hypothetical protein